MIIFICVGYSSIRDRANLNTTNTTAAIDTKAALPVDGNNISKITIYTLPGKDSSLKTTTNENEIMKIVNYINSLNLQKPTEDADKYFGMSYIITIYYDNKTSNEYVHFGNMFFKEWNKDWYEIPYEQAEKFEGIYNNIGKNNKFSHKANTKRAVKLNVPQPFYFIAVYRIF